MFASPGLPALRSGLPLRRAFVVPAVDSTVRPTAASRRMNSRTSGLCSWASRVRRHPVVQRAQHIRNSPHAPSLSLRREAARLNEWLRAHDLTIAI